MRKVLSFLMVLLMVISIIPMQILAADAPAFVVDKITECAAGDTVDVNISVKNNPGIASIKLAVSYDETAMKLTNIAYNSAIGGMAQQPQTKDSPVTLNWFNGSADTTGDWVFATLTFEIAEDAAAAADTSYAIEVTYEANNVYNIAEENVAFDIENGSITVKGVGAPEEPDAPEEKPEEPEVPAGTPEFVVESIANCVVGDIVDVDISVKNNPGIASIKLAVSYDETAMELTNIAYNSAIGGMAQQPETMDSPVTLNWFNGSADTTGDWVFATLTFEIAEDAAAAADTSYAIEVTYEANNVYNIAEENVAFDIENGSISVIHTHNYSATVTEPTCEDVGYTTYTCACGESYVADETAALGHDLEEVDRVDASCKGDGYIKYECTRCDYEKTETLSSAEYGHTQGDELARTEPTCTEKGSVTYKCSVCGEEITKEIAALGHNLKTETTAATCKEEGSVVTTCTRCDYTKTETLAKTSHTFGDWEVVEEATEDEEGLEERTCSVCGEKETREIEKVDDNKWSYLVQTIRRHALSQQKKAKEEAKEEVVEVVVEPDVIDEAIVEEPWENPFIDIFETDSYYAAIEFVYENGLFKGVSATEFAPDTTMTRAMFVTVLGRLHGITEDYVGESVFEDVVAGEWYAPYVVWAADNGIVLGYGDGTFGINDEITVEQAAVILARYAAFIELDVAAEYDLAAEYADAGEVAEWAVDGMTWVVAEGIYNGVEGNLNPQVPAARALVATMLYNFVK